MPVAVHVTVNRPLSLEIRWVRLAGAGSLRSANEVIGDRELIVVKATDVDGHVGWGECPALARPGYTPEYLAGCWTLLGEVLGPTVVADPPGALAYLEGVPGHPMARASLIGALIDLDLRVRGRSLADALADGRPHRATVHSNAVIGIQDEPADLEAAVAAALDAGHASVKLKIRPGNDVDAVRTVRSLWPDLTLAVDANASYEDAESAHRSLSDLEAAAGGLSYCEQPLPADDLVGTAILARRLATPIALDESITSFGRATTALSLGAMGALNLKPARVGGPLTAMAVAQVVAAEGVAVFCGGMVESGLGRAAALAVAAQEPFGLPADLGPSSRYHRVDLTPPFELAHGALRVPEGPGLGVDPDPGVLEAHTVGVRRL